MEKKKLTDEEIVKALKVVGKETLAFAYDKEQKQFKYVTAKEILDLIHRLQEERACFANKVSLYQKLLDEEFEPLKETIKKQKAEIDKLKERNYWLESEHEYQCEKSYFEGVEKGREQAVKDTAIKCLTDIEDCINGMLDGERYMTKNEVEYLLEHILNKKQEYGVEVE